MNRRLALLLSSIGKKELMALTGLGFVGFLLVHLAGNFTIFGGRGAFNGYAAKLESLGPLIWLAESGMVVMFAVHVTIGLLLIYRNWMARGRRYLVKRGEGGQTFASWSMRLTGPWIFGFVLVHLYQFTFQHKLVDTSTPLANLVLDKLANPYWLAYYVVTVAVLGFHASHGFWSALQTLGFGGGRRGVVRESANLIGIIFGVGFALLAGFAFAIQFLPGLAPVLPEVGQLR